MAQTPHKPEQVWYCEDLRGDLSRRDFTVNAMALDKLGNVYDYHGGQQDLEEQVLRTVGDAETRYREDALRMYRACRFVAQLGFDYVQNGSKSLPSAAGHALLSALQLQLSGGPQCRAIAGKGAHRTG